MINPSNRKEEMVYALFDSGADKDFISTELAGRLGLRISSKWTELTSINTTTEGWSPRAEIAIKSSSGSYSSEIEDAIVGDFAAVKGDLPPAKRDLSKAEHLNGIHFIDIDAKIEALISVAHGVTFWGWKIKIGLRNQPILMDTAFGFTVSGINGKKKGSSAAIAALSASDNILKSELKSIFYQDFPHVEHDGKAPSREEEYARTQLKESIKWDEVKGKYSCGLPFKFGREKTAELLNSVDSSSMAKNRMRSLKRNLAVARS